MHEASQQSAGDAVAEAEASKAPARANLMPHNSSTIAGGAFFLAFVLSAVLAPMATARDYINTGFGSQLIIATTLAFFAVVFICQRQMALTLKDAHYGKPVLLATGGLFAWSRNPIYAAFLMPLAAHAWVSPMASLIAITAYILVMNHQVIRGEEETLEAMFGDSYRDYRKRTPRWLLRVGGN